MKCEKERNKKMKCEKERNKKMKCGKERNKKMKCEREKFWIILRRKLEKDFSNQQYPLYAVLP